MDKPKQRGRPRKRRPDGLSGELAAAVEQRRKMMELSAEELGQRAGLGVGTVIRLERGAHSPTLDTVAATAAALGVSAAELLSACPSWTSPPKQKGKRHARET